METRRRGDSETRGHGDAGIRRRGDSETRRLGDSPRRPFSASLFGWQLKLTLVILLLGLWIVFQALPLALAGEGSRVAEYEEKEGNDNGDGGTRERGSEGARGRGDSRRVAASPRPSVTESRLPIPDPLPRYYLIEGIHYLLNEGDRDMAEELFRKAIFSSSFSSLSVRRVRGSDTETRRRGDTAIRRVADVVAEAFYFLGKIHYEKTILDTGYSMLDTGTEKQESNIQNIAWAKKYLRKAEEYGVIYDRLHPPLLDEINRKYPEIAAPVSESNSDKAEIIIEVSDGAYQINAVKVDQHTDVTESTFKSDQVENLECGARYKMKPDIQGRYRTIYGYLAVLGIGILTYSLR